MTERQIEVRLSRARKAQRFNAPNPNADILDPDELGNLREAAFAAKLHRAQRRQELAAQSQAEYEAKLAAGESFAPKPRSGGPRTAEGKAKSSLNNLQHGLTGSFRVIGNERQEEFDSLLTALVAEHQPATTTEHTLVENMAEHLWLCRRAQRLQDFALEEDDIARLNVYLRYQTTNNRAFHKAFAELTRMQNVRARAEKEERNQFVSQKHASEELEWLHTRVRLANARAEEIEWKNQDRRERKMAAAAPAHDVKTSGCLLSGLPILEEHRND